jgi:hypothetical protein
MGIDWNMAGCRAIFIRALNETQIKELHHLEDTRGERYGYGKGNNWLIAPFNIRKLFYPELKDIEISQEDVDTVVILIKRHIPKDIEIGVSHSASVDFQHSWDWNIFHNVAPIETNKKDSRFTGEVD